MLLSKENQDKKQQRFMTFVGMRHSKSATIHAHIENVQ